MFDFFYRRFPRRPGNYTYRLLSEHLFCPNLNSAASTVVGAVEILCVGTVLLVSHQEALLQPHLAAQRLVRAVCNPDVSQGLVITGNVCQFYKILCQFYEILSGVTGINIGLNSSKDPMI